MTRAGSVCTHRSKRASGTLHPFHFTSQYKTQNRAASHARPLMHPQSQSGSGFARVFAARKAQWNWTNPLFAHGRSRATHSLVPGETWMNGKGHESSEEESAAYSPVPGDVDGPKVP